MKSALALALMLSAAALPVRAAVDPAAQPLIERYIAWRGGPAFEAVRSIHEHGALEAMTLKGVGERWMARDGREWETYDLGAFGGASAIAPSGAWTSSQGVVEDTPANVLRDARRSMAIEFGPALHGEAGASVSRLADEQRDGRTWAVVRIGFGDADTYDLFLDPKTGETLGQRIVEDRKERFVRLGDWRMVGPVRMAFRSEELHANPGENVSEQLDRIELDTPADEARLARPQSVRLAAFDGGAHGMAPVAFDFFNDNRIFIPAEVMGHPVKVLLDSGADTTVLDKGFAQSIGVKAEASAVANGTGGQQQAALVHDLKLRIGSMTLTAPTAAIIDLADVSRRLNLPMPVILGAEVFKQLIVDLDFQARTIAFHDPEGFVPPPGAVMAPVTMTGSVPSVPASIEGGPTVQLDFDIGNGSPLLVFPAYWQAHGMLADRPTSKTRGGAVGGLRDEYLARVKSLTFAGVTFHDVPTVFTTPGEGGVDSDRQPGNIGLPIYSRFRLITDYPHGRLWLVPAADAAGKPFAHDRSGLSTALDHDRLRVVAVATGSPAQAQGWKEGDLIVAIDGRPIDAAYPGSLLSHWNSGDAGRQVALTGADGRVRTLTLRDYY